MTLIFNPYILTRTFAYIKYKVQQPITSDVLTLITGTGGAIVILFLAVRYLMRYNEKKDERIEELQESAVKMRDDIVKNRDLQLAEKDRQIEDLIKQLFEARKQ